MAKVIMVQGTTSNAGKSIVTAALCRIFKQDGYKVAPFKSQNMALNSYITKDGLEMGRAQVMQAEAAGIEPDVRMNPILLKPTGDKGSQVILNGSVLGDMSAKDYYKQKTMLIPHILKSYNSLAEENDVIVIEGAGSPAEINLRENDIVNMGMAELVDAPVILVGDIDRGGVFASIAGTLLLLTDDEKKRVKGTVINKFRGDVDILKPGLDMLEDITHVGVLGVIPYMKLQIDDEDSLSERLDNKNELKLIDIAVIKLPRLSNFTDFNVFEMFNGVSVRYVSNVHDLCDPDMVILPGTKNTIEDLKWLRQSGLEAKIQRFAHQGKPVFGICGGYQMLGDKIYDPESVESGGEIRGLGLLNTETTFYQEKIRTQVKGKFKEINGLYNYLSNIEFEGYEIHMGDTNTQNVEPLSSINVISDTLANKVKNDGVVNKNVAGSYIHGIFDNSNVANAIVEMLYDRKGLNKEELEGFDINQFKNSQYDLLADTVRKSLDMDKIYAIIK
ncbi:cobyric acid synthase [Sedimentibacter sp. zth1]|uniref:cobyric acid synthase n=1 Tax=Sedimentibacter sp. zth1 TaxID=2816908 RepID=UPI001A936ACE|nr:cobyric acid synthase [Sedimentibacter sp. zth1]QSX06340.1 cobyric acid synthase [Sedimentibacter sp. zth1]